MNKSLLLSIYLILFGGICLGQKISGNITDSASGEALPFATISVKDENGMILTGTLTDENGNYEIVLPKPAHTLEIDHIGYTKQMISKPFNPSNLAKISLIIDETQLDEVVVEGERTSREFMIDRKIINFGSDLQTSGGNVLEAFEQLPDVETNQATGDVRLRGNSNVRILVNGKPSPLNNQDLLEQLNASQVEKVEIITSPSAKYQADGLAGIINIVLKDKIIDGIAGSANINARTNPGYGGSFNLTSGFKSFNLQTTLSHRDNFFKNKDYTNRQLLIIDEEQQVSTKSEFDGQVNNFNFKADWFINPLNDLSLSVNMTNNEHEIDNATLIVGENETLDNQLINYHKHNTAEYNINFRKKFDENNSSYLDVDVNYNDNNNTLPSTIYNNGQLTLENEVFFNNEIVNGAIDFVAPVGKAKLETGVLYTFKSIDNDQNTFTNNESMASFYNYEENTYAGYLLIKKQFDKTGIQIGLRGEKFVSNGNVSDSEQVIDLDFFNIFPSFHLQHKKSDKLNYTFAYNRRIARPSFYNINPITTINDPLFRRIGNPGLTPEFTDNLELGMHLNTSKININTSLYYRYMTDLINQTYDADSEGITIMSFENGGESQTIGSEINISKDFSEKISASVSGNVYYQYAEPKINDFYYEDQYNYNVRTSFNYKPSKKLSLDLQWLYFGNSRRLNVVIDDRNFMNLAARYKVLDGAGTINLRLSDIFRGNIYENTRLSNEIKEDRKWLGQTRLAILSFSYNFSKGSIKRRKASRKRYDESGALE